MRRRLVVAALVVALVGFVALGPESRAGRAEEPVREAVIYSDPGCPCGPGYGAYLEANGFIVTHVVSTPELDAIKAKYQVPQALVANQSTLIGRYVIEGNVPVSAILRLLREAPPILGIALPGMPSGAPGIGGEKLGAFPIYVISNDPRPPLFAIE